MLRCSASVTRPCLSHRTPRALPRAFLRSTRGRSILLGAPKDKAVENLAAGDLLVERGHPNAAASRYDYAMFQAAVHRLTQRGIRPEAVRSGAIDWDHSMVLNTTRWLRRSWRDQLLYLEMRRLRAEAGYGDEPFSVSDLTDRRASIRDFVKELAR